MKDFSDFANTWFSLHLQPNISLMIIFCLQVCQEYSMKYIYSISQISKLSLTLCTFSITGSVAGLFLT